MALAWLPISVEAVGCFAVWMVFAGGFLVSFFAR